MTYQTKKRMFVAVSLLMVLAAIYCGLAILQAVMLFTGERTLRNLHFWGPLMCVAVAFSVLFGILAFRVGRLAKIRGR